MHERACLVHTGGSLIGRGIGGRAARQLRPWIELPGSRGTMERPAVVGRWWHHPGGGQTNARTNQPRLQPPASATRTSSSPKEWARARHIGALTRLPPRHDAAVGRASTPRPTTIHHVIAHAKPNRALVAGGETNENGMTWCSSAWIDHIAAQEMFQRKHLGENWRTRPICQTSRRTWGTPTIGYQGMKIPLG